jgi:hypothetical protein
MSLMDAMFALPMADILRRVEVADEVYDALLGHKGDFGRMLEVVELLEGAEDGKALKSALRKLGLTVKQVRDIELAAFDWVRELAYEVHSPDGAHECAPYGSPCGRVGCALVRTRGIRPPRRPAYCPRNKNTVGFL